MCCLLESVLDRKKDYAQPKMDLGHALAALLETASAVVNAKHANHQTTGLLD